MKICTYPFLNLFFNIWWVFLPAESCATILRKTTDIRVDLVSNKLTISGLKCSCLQSRKKRSCKLSTWVPSASKKSWIRTGLLGQREHFLLYLWPLPWVRWTCSAKAPGCEPRRSPCGARCRRKCLWLRCTGAAVAPTSTRPLLSAAAPTLKNGNVTWSKPDHFKFVQPKIKNKNKFTKNMFLIIIKKSHRLRAFAWQRGPLWSARPRRSVGDQLQWHGARWPFLYFAAPYMIWKVNVQII